jgi:hypothetical protein
MTDQDYGPMLLVTFGQFLLWRSPIMTMLEVFMSCSSHQSLFDSDKRIWEAWKRLNDKTNRSASQTDEMHRLAGAGGDSSQAVTDHIADCPECEKETDVTAS